MNQYSRPSLLLTAFETRALSELAAFSWSLPWLQMTPKGDGHPVMVLPGFMTSDVSTIPLRLFLRSRGYRPYGWNLGRNLGQGIDVRKGIPDNSYILRRVEAISERHDGQRVSLIGWSLGGIYAREIARRLPNLVRTVITMGSPFSGDPKANHVAGLFERFSGKEIETISPELRALVNTPPPVPSTAIFSRTDGITDWRCCLEQVDDSTENISVFSSHNGLGHNPMVMCIIADRLAQAEGDWSPFDNRGLRSLFYGDGKTRRLGFI